MMNKSQQIRKIIDQNFSLQWCRENIVVPLTVEQNNINGNERLTIAIGNISYLATIGDFIKDRAKRSGFECQFIEKPAHEIQALLDQVAQERLISGDSRTLDGIDLVMMQSLALKGVEDDSGTQGFDFDFDDSEEQIIEEQALDLATEMLKQDPTSGGQNPNSCSSIRCLRYPRRTKT